nr:outer membrane beta-barrel protein [Cytophagales bacterium]
MEPTETSRIGTEEVPPVTTEETTTTDKPKKKRRASGGGFGIKGGMNYNSNGNYFDDAQLIFGDPLNNLGFHAGFFGKIKFGPFFLRPELMYSQLKTELNNETFLTQRADAPVLLGVGILRQFLTVFAGPSFHYTLNDDLAVTSAQNALNMGYQAGFGINIEKLGIDLRYERVLSGTAIDFNQIITGAGDYKSQQLIGGISIKF